MFSLKNSKKIKSNDLHSVSRIQQDRQREPSVKTLCYPFSRGAGGTQRRTFALVPERRNNKN